MENKEKGKAVVDESSEPPIIPWSEIEELMVDEDFEGGTKMDGEVEFTTDELTLIESILEDHAVTIAASDAAPHPLPAASMQTTGYHGAPAPADAVLPTLPRPPPLPSRPAGSHGASGVPTARPPLPWNMMSPVSQRASTGVFLPRMPRYPPPPPLPSTPAGSYGSGGRLTARPPLPWNGMSPVSQRASTGTGVFLPTIPRYPPPPPPPPPLPSTPAGSYGAGGVLTARPPLPWNRMRPVSQRAPTGFVLPTMPRYPPPLPLLPMGSNGTGRVLTTRRRPVPWTYMQPVRHRPPTGPVLPTPPPPPPPPQPSNVATAMNAGFSNTSGPATTGLIPSSDLTRCLACNTRSKQLKESELWLDPPAVRLEPHMCLCYECDAMVDPRDYCAVCRDHTERVMRTGRVICR